MKSLDHMKIQVNIKCPFKKEDKLIDNNYVEEKGKYTFEKLTQDDLYNYHETFTLI